MRTSTRPFSPFGRGPGRGSTPFVAVALLLGLGLGACEPEPDRPADVDEEWLEEEERWPEDQEAEREPPPVDPRTGDRAEVPTRPDERPERDPPPELAEERPEEPETAIGPAIPAGSLLTFEVTETVSSETHREGDTFALRMTESVQGEDGAVLREGTEARGVVIDARESEGPEDEAVLAIDIAAVQANGEFVPIPGTVESATTETARRDSDARTAAKIATGAAAGAVVGQILGRDTRSTVGGAVVGAAAGVGLALTTREGHAVLPEGAIITVRLDEALRVAPE